MDKIPPELITLQALLDRFTTAGVLRFIAVCSADRAAESGSEGWEQISRLILRTAEQVHSLEPPKKED
jgi:hypothetical protein